MNPGKARFTLRYLFAHSDFIDSIRYEPSDKISVVFANGVKTSLTAVADALGAQPTFIASDLRIVAPHVRLIDARLDGPAETAAGWAGVRPPPGLAADC